MKPIKSIPALVPKATQNFKCLAGECPDTCCTGWEIPIDKITFKNYKKSSSPELSVLFDEKLKRVKKPSSWRYATVKMNEGDCSCSFLDHGLCKIQKVLGEAALSDTCSGYPRVTVRHGSLFQQGLTLSCPAAAQAVLLQDQATEFIKAVVQTREEQIRSVGGADGAAAEVAQNARFFALALMRREDFQTWEKMAILGFFCEEADVLQKQENFLSIGILIEKYEKILEEQTLTHILSGIKSYPSAQISVFAGILLPQLLRENTRSQKNILDELMASVFEVGAKPYDEIKKIALEKYIVGAENINKALLKKQNFIPNYLINQMFNEIFPLNEPSIFRSYLRLVSRYGSLRLLLALQCSNPTKLPSPPEMAALTQVYARKFEHNVPFKNKINEALEAVGFNSMKYVCGIIRD
ncbi:MAG: flagellin lysine-N-methylase [Chakrabartia sp.]